jgi:DNA-binding CsgD family transcriptional regulator
MRWRGLCISPCHRTHAAPGDDDLALETAGQSVDMRRNESVLLELVRLIYVAGLNADGWTAFHEQYRLAMGAACISFIFRNRRTGQSMATVATGPAAAEAMQQYNAYYGARNPLLSNGKQLLRPGAVTLSQVLDPPDRFLKTEYYNDFARPLDVCCGIGAWLIENDEISANISCNRSWRVGWYSAEDVAFLERLIPHLQRALQIHLRLGGLRIDRETEAGALDLAAAGVLVVSGDARVLLVNAAARRILAARDGLSATPDGLRAANAVQTKTLRALVAAAARGAQGSRLHAGGLLRLPRPSMRQPLSVLVAPTRPTLSYPVLPASAVTILVRDPEESPDAHSLLARLYGLTNRETALAGALLQGLSLPASCETLAITRETAKTHLRAILRKSGTRRQSDFVRRAMISLAGQVNAPGDRLQSTRHPAAAYS